MAERATTSPACDADQPRPARACPAAPPPRDPGGLTGTGESIPYRDEDALLDGIQRDTFQYFMHQTNPANGLVSDSTKQPTAASITAVGFGLTAYPIGVERGCVSRAVASAHTLATLRFFWRGPQGSQDAAIGQHGFYYHFLDLQSGTARGTRRSRLSTRRICSQAH